MGRSLETCTALTLLEVALDARVTRQSFAGCDPARLGRQRTGANHADEFALLVELANKSLHALVLTQSSTKVSIRVNEIQEFRLSRCNVLGTLCATWDDLWRQTNTSVEINRRTWVH